MPEQPAHGGNVNALHDQVAGKRMTQIVERKVHDASLLQGGRKRFLYVADWPNAFYGLAILGGLEIAGIWKDPRNVNAPGQGLQHPIEGVVNWNLTGLARLRGGVAQEDEPTTNKNKGLR